MSHTRWKQNILIISLPSGHAGNTAGLIVLIFVALQPRLEHWLVFEEGVGGKNIFTSGEHSVSKPHIRRMSYLKGFWVKCYILQRDKWGDKSAAAFKCVCERDLGLSFDKWDETCAMSKDLKVVEFKILHCQYRASCVTETWLKILLSAGKCCILSKTFLNLEVLSAFNWSSWLLPDSNNDYSQDWLLYRTGRLSQDCIVGNKTKARYLLWVACILLIKMHKKMLFCTDISQS